MSGISAAAPGGGTPGSIGIQRLWKRELTSYPTLQRRAVYLTIVVIVTILFYYQYYVISAVGDQVISSTGMSFHYFVDVNVLSAFASALASIFGGLTDRYGRANLVVVGVLGCALTCLLGLPNVHSAFGVLIFYSVLGALEGVVLVATSALVRDFSPQVGRATAMGFWTLGPVVGSLVTSLVVTNTFHAGSHWQAQYTIAGWAGIGVFLLALLLLRELAPELRDQLLVSERDRALLEARAAGVDVDEALKRPLRAILRPNIVVPAIGISLFLFIYYAAVGFFPIFFQTIFGYSTAKANHLGNWMWGIQTVSLILVGLASDRLRVRKPFMVAGAIGALVMTGMLISHTSQPKTSFDTWVLILTLLGLFLGLGFAPWMAAFTETVERQNPALSATGLSLWGLIVRMVVTLATFVLPYMVSTVTPIIDNGPTVQALATKYAPELATVDKLTASTQAGLSAHPNSPAVQAEAISELSGVAVNTVARAIAIDDKYGPELTTAQTLSLSTQLSLLSSPNSASTEAEAVGEIAKGLKISTAAATKALAALGRVPNSDLEFMSANGQPVLNAANKLEALDKVPASAEDYLQKYGTKVQNAVKKSPGQWKHYFGIGLIGEALFLPSIFLLVGFWRPRNAKRAFEEYEKDSDHALGSLGES